MSTGQWMRPTGSAPWFFDAGAESLDFAYTGDMGRDVPEWEQLRSPDDLGRWVAERFDRVDASDASPRDLVDARALRDSISRLYVGAARQEPVAPDDVDTVNLYAAMPDIPPALAGGHRRAGADRIRVAQALTSLARDAIAVLAADARPSDGGQRIRACDADDCRMVFHDESRTNNRRWCAMERCGNRAKVRAHRERVAMTRYRTSEKEKR